MGWFRLSGTFTDHPKVIAAGNAAIGLYVRLGCWSAEHETDGFVPEEVAHRNGSRRELARLIIQPRPGVRALLEEVSGGYLLRDFLSFNPSHEQQTHERELRAKRQARWRSREPVDASRDASRDAYGDGASTPLHSLTTQSLSLNSSTAQDARGRDADQLATEALALVAESLAAVHAAPGKRSVYARTVIRNGDDHLPALRTIARDPELKSASDVANAYTTRGTDRAQSHDSCGVCFGAGWLLVDDSDPSRGVVPCAGES